MSETQKRRPGQYVVLVLLCVLLLAVTYSTLVAVLMGLLISLLCRPIYVRVNHLVRDRSNLSALLCALLLVICVLVPLTLITISVVESVASVVKGFGDSIHSQNIAQMQVLEIPFIASLYEKLNTFIHLSQEEFVDRFKQVMVVVVSYGTGFVGNFAASVPGVVGSMFFFLLSFYFGLVDGPALADFIRDSLPFGEKETDRFFATVSGISKGVVLGALVSGVVQGIIIGLGYWIFSIPRPFFYGAITFILSFIPLFGSLPTGVGGILYLVFDHRYGAAIGMGVTFLISSLSDNVVKPWLLKGQAALHPLLGLISVLGGLQLFGFSGLLLGPLIAALSIAAIQFVLHPEAQRVKTGS